MAIDGDPLPSWLVRIFLAGATGVIGSRLVPLLVAEGHQVTGMTRSPDKAGPLRELGADPVVCDVFDRDSLREAIVRARPDAILHELTDLPDDARRVPELAAANNRIRREGTRNLLDAAEAAEVGRFVAQSVAWDLPGEGGQAAADLERAVLEFGGVVVRYGRFYGPGTYHEADPPDPPRIHVDEAARRTIPALSAPSGILVVAEDEPSDASP